MTNWIIVGAAIVIAVLVGGLYQSVSVQGPARIRRHQSVDWSYAGFFFCAKKLSERKPKARLVSASTPVPASAPRLIGRPSSWTRRSPDGEPPALGPLSPRVEAVRRRD
jgi:hypothetical protein